MKKTISLLIFGLVFIPAVSLASIDSNLSYGSQGQSVTELQEFLIDKGYLQGQASGNFYSLTLRAVKAFQTAKGIPSTGYVGNLTRAEINSELTLETASSTQEQTQETGTSATAVASTPAVAQPVPTVPTPTNYNLSVDYSSFTKIQMSQYANNSSAYSGQKVEFIGSVTTFMAKGNGGGSANYVTLLDPMANTQVMVSVADDTAYTALVNKVKPGDTFRVYGIGVAGQKFMSAYGTKMVVPVIQLSAADDCDAGSSVTNLTSDNSPYGWTCAGTMQHIVP